LALALERAGAERRSLSMKRLTPIDWLRVRIASLILGKRLWRWLNAGRFGILSLHHACGLREKNEVYGVYYHSESSGEEKAQ
jgi:hypothetical protein